MCVYYFGDFAGNISDFMIPNIMVSRFHLFLKQKFSKEKKIYHNVSTCCAEAQNSHCGLQENNFRQCYISCFEALNYKL